MPALSGQLITTIPDANGAPGVTVTWFWNPATGVLRNNPIAWTSPDGTVWPIGSGAVIAANQLGRAVKVVVNDINGNMVRRVNVPAGGRVATAVQMANLPPPDGPYTNQSDFNGLTFDLS